MGANTFIHIAEGRTADEAFDRARDDARYEHGHGGYSGSIAEKDRFVMIDDDGRAIKALATRAIKRERRAIKAYREMGHRARYDVAHHRAMLKQYQAVKRAARVRMTPVQIADALIDLDDPRVDDKWGPAGCINMTPRRKAAGSVKRFLFFGWASS